MTASEAGNSHGHQVLQKLRASPAGLCLNKLATGPPCLTDWPTGPLGKPFPRMNFYRRGRNSA